MSLPQHLIREVGGVVRTHVATQPAACYVRIIDGSGLERLSSTAANISSINTTLSNAVSRGDMWLSVASNTGLSVGKRFFVQDDPEECIVRSVAGTNIRLRRPAMYDHVSGAVVEGTELSYAVNAQTANSKFWDGRVQWNIDGTVSHYTAVACTEYPLKRMASSVDITDIEPRFYYMVDSEQDIERLLDLGHQEVMKLIGEMAPDRRVEVNPASDEYRHATALAAIMYHYMAQRGDDMKELAERYETRLQKEMARIVPMIPRDANQDGVIQEDERITPRSRRIYRG